MSLVDGDQDDYMHGRDLDTHSLRLKKDFRIPQKARESATCKPGKRSLVGLAAGCDHCHQCARDAASIGLDLPVRSAILLAGTQWTVTLSWVTLVADADV